MVLHKWWEFTTVLILLALAVIAFETMNVVRVTGERANDIVEEDKMIEASWDHCPGGTGNPIKMKVSETDQQSFDQKLAYNLNQYPPNCP